MTEQYPIMEGEITYIGAASAEAELIIGSYTVGVIVWPCIQEVVANGFNVWAKEWGSYKCKKPRLQ